MTTRLGIATAVAILILGALLRQNPRAVVIGPFILATIAAAFLSVGALLGWSDTGPSNLRLLATTAGVGIVLALMALGAIFWSSSSAGARLMWAALSTVAWSIALGIIWSAWEPLQDERDRAADAAEQAKYQQEIAEQEAARLARAAPPGDRGRQLDSVLAAIQHDRTEEMDKLSRFVRFGDPETKPESITVWVVWQERPSQRFADMGRATAMVRAQLFNELRRVAWPGTVALGAVSEATIASGGGDDGWFGPLGSNVIPQFPADALLAPWRVGVELQLPQRRPTDGPPLTPPT
jgi:hypothetical protein